MNIVNERTKIKEKVKSYLTGLSDIESKVLELRFGINDDMPKTLSEVSDVLNISKDDVRKIEDKALKMAVNWCKSIGIEFDAINENLSPKFQVENYGYNCRKIYADIYFDDKAKKS